MTTTSTTDDVSVTTVEDVLQVVKKITSHQVDCTRCGGRWVYDGANMAHEQAAAHADTCTEAARAGGGSWTGR